MWDILRGIFGFDGVGQSALKIVDKLAGTDWTPKEKSEFFLAYQAGTKHQSPIRRFIATLIATTWTLMALTWLAATIFGRLYYEEALNPGTVLAADISAFMSTTLAEPFNLIIIFYFSVQIASGVANGFKK